jgi:L-ectoine synthase
MRVIGLTDYDGTDRDVSTGDWRSRRLLVARDQLGYSMHHTKVRPGAVMPMHYLHHIEAVYIIDGEGEIVDEDSRERHRIGPGSVYVLDKHDRHTLYATTTIAAVCIFTPACEGSETHDETGSYPATPVTT